MRLFPLILVYVCYTGRLNAYPPKTPIVNTKYGPVLGLTQLSRNGREYSSFRGIPYAKAPIGELRFKEPQPPEAWSFAINATKDAPFCIQKNYFFKDPKVEGNEDCLYLNIYVPKVESTQLLPVLVFIHWGGFFAGRGSSDYIGPEYFMDKDVILVTFNYRLGIFGFFTTLDDNAPGNFGLKDQVMALKFVQENVECFGGDKNRVTLSGQSAGSGSVSLHLVSPLSRGLFQQAISQSGVSLDLWAKPLNPVQPDVIKAVAFFTGCVAQLNSTVELVKCLREVDAAKLVEIGDNFKYFSIEPLTPYTVVTEKESQANPNPFLTKDPLEYIQEGEFSNVPYIVGTVESEGILRVAPLTRQVDTLKVLNSNFSNLLPQLLSLQVSVGTNTSELYDRIVKFYLGGNQAIDVSEPRSVQGFIDLYSDRAFIYGTYQAIFLQSRKGHRPIWVYNFNYRGQYSYGDQFAATTNNIDFDWGVSHCDDLLYLYRSPALFPDLQQATDFLMSDALLSLWTNFVIFGNPDPLDQIHWTSLDFKNADDIRNENMNILNITGSWECNQIHFLMQKGYHTERMQFWMNQTLAENFPGLQ